MSTISVCMIVKNEEKVLARCLDSMAGIWDELIIVDTGSTDATKEIAHRYTDLVFDFAWINDFAAARNFAFSKATKEYIYSADADEMLNEENRLQMLTLKELMMPEIEIVQMWYLTPEEFNTTENYRRDLRPKLYRRLRTFTWIDPVHESVRIDPVVYDSDIEILHLPQSLHAERDLSIFRRNTKDMQKLSHKLHYMYARELLIAGGIEDCLEAEPYFSGVYEDMDADEEMVTEAMVILLRIKRVLDKNDEFLQLLATAKERLCCSEVFTEEGIYSYDHKDYATAKKSFETAMSEEALIYLAAKEDIPQRYMEKINGHLPGISE